METFLKNTKELSKSYFDKAIFYLENSKLEQAIIQSQKAKKKLSNPS